MTPFMRTLLAMIGLLTPHITTDAQAADAVTWHGAVTQAMRCTAPAPGASPHCAPAPGGQCALQLAAAFSRDGGRIALTVAGRTHAFDVAPIRRGTDEEGPFVDLGATTSDGAGVEIRFPESEGGGLGVPRRLDARLEPGSEDGDKESWTQLICGGFAR